MKLNTAPKNFEVQQTIGEKYEIYMEFLHIWQKLSIRDRKPLFPHLARLWSRWANALSDDR